MAATAALTLAPGHPADAAKFLPEIVASFNLATFTPQVFWFAMILAPRNPVVKTVMGSWLPVLIASGIHFYVDYVGFNQPGALEEAAKFGAAVFGAADALEKANAGRDSKLSVTKLS